MGILYVVATPIGNLQDLSKRALEILSTSDYILAEDTRQTIKLLNYFEFHTPMISYHKFNEKERCEEMISLLKNGKNIALVSDAGTPCISDPGYVLVKRAREENISVIGIPGCSASVLALSISGLDSTHFTFIGFLSREKKKMNEELEQIQNSSFSTFLFYESPKRIVTFISTLMTYFPNSLVFIGSDLTKLHERSFYGKIEDVYQKIKNDSNIEKGEYVVVLEKQTKEEVKVEDEISYEAMIIDYMVKEKKTMKEAIKELSKNQKLAKNNLYDASLNLKNLLGNHDSCE